MSKIKQVAIYLFSYDGITSWSCGVGTVVRHFIHSMPVVAEYLQKHDLQTVFYVGTPFYNPECAWYRPEMLKQAEQICSSLSGDMLYQLNGTQGDDMYVDLEQWKATSIGAANLAINYFQKHEFNIVFTNDPPYCGVSYFLFQQLSQYKGKKPNIVWIPHSTGLIHEKTKDEIRYNWERQAVGDANTYKECFIAYINDFMKNHLLCDFQASPDSLVSLTNGLPLFENLTSSNPQEVIEKYGLPSDKDIVFATGRATKYKGFEYLVRAFAESQANHAAELVLLVTSFATSQTKNSYQDIVKEFQELQVRGKVIHAFIPQEDLRAIFRLPNVKSIVVPSLSEPFGMIPLEVRHWCTDNAPVLVCSQADGLKELINQGEDGFLVDVENTSEFAQALTRAVNMSSEERKGFLSKGKEKLARKYNLPRNIADCILNIVSQQD
ncbi:group 1 glycosyl transferase [Tolypothrix sp. NIES-4075]|uniref:glycosyltransferase family 4 protein n=1 Tax=Tolypothrix sp. NIES-4075 TaxID=2005459 RepID=UPI000B5CB609|nr:glycosyltransferase family 4 protein [Tolypothrix sp. NIES-4075]GAX43185.1 group 1 glycosyl transferase [Tolypothrix sp. NIES-4075]